MSPPNLPTPDFFVPLGALIAYVRSGKKFVAVEPDDIRAGELGGRGRMDCRGAAWLLPRRPSAFSLRPGQLPALPACLAIMGAWGRGYGIRPTR